MNKRKGYALIELLVAIAVVVLLMAILMPALQRVRNQAQTVACQSNLKQWSLYFSMYTHDNNGKFFAHWLNPRTHWLQVMQPYYADNNDVFLCPTAPKDESVADEYYTVGGKFSAWTFHPAPPPPGLHAERVCGSYGLNSWVSDVPQASTAPAYSPDNGDYLWCWRTCYVNAAATVPVLLDCALPSAPPRDTDRPPEYGDTCFSCSPMSAFCIDRHDGHVNSLFMDWSVRKVALKELWVLKWHRQFNTAGPWTKSGGVQPSCWPEWMRNLEDY
jgi:prepilin-type N-terminal cleavage/methylation domain-containing protein/prepilin-type processing-associated H-X9-DG protein